MTRHRVVRALVAAVIAGAALAGCGGGGLTAEGVADELGKLYPLPNPRDNTEACDGDGGCAQLITTDPVSIYQWQTPADAQRHAAGLPDAHAAGVFVLRFPDDYPSSEESKAAYAKRLDELVAAEGSG